MHITTAGFHATLRILMEMSCEITVIVSIVLYYSIIVPVFPVATRRILMEMPWEITVIASIVLYYPPYS